MTDLERKIYRIIYNMGRFRKNPTMDDLKRKTGRDEATIRKAVTNLMTRNELAWDKEKQEWRSNKKAHQRRLFIQTLSRLHLLGIFPVNLVKP